MKHVLLLMLLALPWAFLPAQLRDTLHIAGHTYEFVTSTQSEENGSGETYITGVVRLDGGRKWLKTIRLEMTSHDCNSLELELGSYTVQDTLLTVYTLWDHSSEAMAGVEGMRVSRFVFTREGSLRLQDSRMAVSPAPMHQSLDGLAFHDPSTRAAGSTASERRDQATFLRRLEAAYQSTQVDGEARTALAQEMPAALESRRAELMKPYK